MAVTKLGQINSTGSEEALYLRIWDQELKSVFNRLDYFAGVDFPSYPCVAATSVQSAWFGETNVSPFLLGSNIDVAAEGGTAVNKQIAKFQRLTFLDPMSINATTIHLTDEMKAPEGTSARMRVTRQLVEAHAKEKNLHIISALMQTASMPDMGGKVAGDTKTTAGTKAGVSDGVVGLHIDANIFTSGAAAEDVAWKMWLWLNYLGVPDDERYILIDPRIARNIFKDVGVANPLTAAANATTLVTKSLDKNFGGSGSVEFAMLPRLANMRPIVCPYLSSFGDAIEAFNPLGATGGKYQPGSTETDTLYGLNGVDAPNGCYDQNTNPNPVDWDVNAVNVRELWNNVGMIAFHKSAIAKANNMELSVDGPYEHKGFRGHRMVVERCEGWGPGYDAVIYAASAKSS